MSVCPYCWNHVSVYPLWKAGRPPDAFPQLFVYLFLLNVEVCMSEICFFFEGRVVLFVFGFFVQMFAGEGSERSPPDQSDLIYFHIPQGKKAVHFEGNRDCDWSLKEEKKGVLWERMKVCMCVSFFFFLFIFLYAHNANWLKSSCKGLASTLWPVLLYCLHWDSSLLLIISCIFYILFLQSDAICFFAVRSFVFLSDGFTTYMFRPGVLVDRCLCTVMLLALFCTSWGSMSGL